MGIKVLSLFDGISCGMVALERAGIKVDEYYASEIDKYAIKVSEKNYPNIKRIGDVTKVKGADLPKIDLLVGGSPCQGFSFAGKQLNFNDERSKLFFEYVRLLKETKPKYFLLENVKMKKEYQDVISKFLGVEPIEINSALVSAQNRKRLYWTNIPNITQPEDQGILLKTIVHENTEVFEEKAATIKSQYQNSSRANFIRSGSFHATGVFEWLKEYIVPFDKTLKILEKEVERGKVGYFKAGSQANRVYYIHDKVVTLCGETGDGAAKIDQYLFGCITPDRINKRQNGQRFNDGNKFYTLTVQDQHGILIEGYIRKLTPVECERLQTLIDNYTSGISNAQRYKCLGNGWTVDVIVHIFKNMEV
jgi:DNA-cytosine methyltransferase